LEYYQNKFGVQLQFKRALFAVMANLNNETSIEDIVGKVREHVYSKYYSEFETDAALIRSEIESISYHSIQSYVSGTVPSGKAMYSNSQQGFISMLLNNSLGSKENINGVIGDVFQKVKEEVVKADLSDEEQRPLLLSCDIGAGANEIWVEDVFKNATSTLNRGGIATFAKDNISSTWTKSCVDGALAGLSADIAGLARYSKNTSEREVVFSIIGALTVSVGKIVLNWTPRTLKKLKLDSKVIYELNKYDLTQWSFPTNCHNIGGSTVPDLCTGSLGCPPVTGPHRIPISVPGMPGGCVPFCLTSNPPPVPTGTGPVIIIPPNGRICVQASTEGLA